MSFGISFVGSKEGVSKAVREMKSYGDPSQFDAARAYILTEIAAVPDTRGVRVEANGHHDDYARILKIEVTAIDLAV